MERRRQGRDVCVAGVGWTSQGRHPGRTGNDLAVEAVDAALQDAGIGRSDVDGLITCKALMGAPGDGLDVPIGHMLGINPDYSATLDYGTCNFSVHLAAMAIRSGLASTVVLAYGTIQGSRMGDAGFAGLVTPESTYGAMDPMGFLSALMFRRAIERHGVTEEQLGSISVAQRKWAALNPHAVRREVMTIDDYLAEPYYVNPIRKFDVAPFDDGGVALVMTTLERARDMRADPVAILGMSQTTALRGYDNPDQLERAWIERAADAVFRDAELARADIDVVSIQDPTSIWTMQMLELFGFVGTGEALPFISEGHTSPGGSLPVNTSGGHLSESYMWGWMHTVEVVNQLRGVCGDRQVPGAEAAIHCSTMTTNKAAATIFGATR